MGARQVYLLMAALLPSTALAGMPFNPLPDWESGDVGMRATGGALVDLDRDGWLDLVVSNGNDMATHLNRVSKVLPASPENIPAGIFRQ